MRNAFGDAPKGGEAAQTSTTDDDQVGILARADQCGHGVARVDFRTHETRWIELLATRCRDSPQLRAERISQCLTDGFGISRVRRAIDTDDDPLREQVGIGTLAADEHR